MKKILSLILALAMLLSLAACGDGRDVSGTVTPAESAVPAEEPAAESAAPAEEPAAEEPAEEPAEAPEEEAAEPVVQFGTAAGGHYENEFLGIACDLDGNWSFASQEELAEMIGATVDLFSEDFARQAENVEMFYDMLATSTDGLATINIVVQNMGLVYGLAVTEEQIVDATLSQLEKELANMGLTDIQMEKNQLSFCGQERLGLHISAKNQGVDLYEQQVYLKVGQYMVAVTFVSYLEDVCASFADYFYAL